VAGLARRNPGVGEGVDLAGDALALGVEEADAQRRAVTARSTTLRITPETANTAWPCCSDGSARTSSMTRPTGFTVRPMAR